MAEPSKAVKVTSPRGIAQFPKLNEPDTKFKTEGEYSVNLLLDPEQAEPLIEKIDRLMQESLKEGQANAATPAKAKKAKLIDPPYADDETKEGELTGKVKFKFKMKASGVSRKTGKPWKMAPALFDSKARPIPRSVIITPGSEIVVAGELRKWCNPKMECGVSLRLDGVQVLKLAESGFSASSLGFSAAEDEDGFQAPSDIGGGNVTDAAPEADEATESVGSAKDF